MGLATDLTLAAMGRMNGLELGRSRAEQITFSSWAAQIFTWVTETSGGVKVIAELEQRGVSKYICYNSDLSQFLTRDEGRGLKAKTRTYVGLMNGYQDAVVETSVPPRLSIIRGHEFPLVIRVSDPNPLFA